MGCSHAADCPLFPLLRSSLQGWRDHYCDSTDKWHDCARYQLSLTGERVPISLLPNGHRALHLAAEANWSGEAESKRAPRREPRQEPRQEQSRQDFRQPSMPDLEAEPWRPSPDARAAFEPAVPPSQVPRHQPPSPERLAPSPEPPSRKRQKTGQKRGWLVRLVDWMSSPS